MLAMGELEASLMARFENMPVTLGSDLSCFVLGFIILPQTRKLSKLAPPKYSFHSELRVSLDNRLSPSMVPSRADLRIGEIFAELFGTQYHTELVGGAEEPLYLPSADESPARIYYRFDYERSALHEVAHWCIAGEQRRSQEDYGYWYAPDGRSAAQQEQFVAVEAKPQAVEWYLSVAAGLKFGVSVDNLDYPTDPTALKDAVYAQLGEYLVTGFPARAQQFARALATAFGGEIISLASLPERANLD